MLKLVIVDDERLDAIGLTRQLDWTAYDISEVYTAQNGFQAIELLKERCPDILITDIKMPGMTGLQLAEKAKEIMPHIKVIFVSGYDDFAFLKSAIKMNAYEYILKPVDTKELAASVKKVVADRLLELKEHQEKHELQNVVNESKPLLRNKFLVNLIYNTAEKESLWEKINRLMIDIRPGKQAVLLFEIDDFIQIKGKMSREEIDSRLDTLQDIIRACIAGFFALETVRTEEQRVAAIVSAVENNDPSVRESAVSEIGEKIINAAKTDIGMSVTIGVGSFVNQPSELYRSYDESLQAVLTKIYQGKGRVLRVLEPVETADTEIRSENIDKEIVKCLINYDSSRINHLLDCLFDRLEAERNNSGRLVQDYCINIISRSQIALYDLNIHVEDIFGPGIILWEKVMKFETILDIRQWMKNVLGAMVNYLQMRNEARNSKMIEDVFEYIQIHYKEDISLKSIAESLFYSPNYLGCIFKQETGQSFSDYLVEFRMKKAAELLSDHRVKAYEAAGSVGYRDIPSFIKKFKAVYGVTPTEYRGRCR